MRRAERQIDHETDWYAENAVELGRRWASGVSKAIASLAENPDRCGIAHETDQLDFELRELLYGLERKKTHRILFRIREKSVEVLAVRHVAQQDVSTDDF